MKKKTTLSIAVFLLLSICCHAQFSIGLKGSFNQSWYDSHTQLYSKSQEKLSGMGITVETYYQFGKHWSIGIEPGLVQRGAIEPVDYYCIGFCATGIDFSQFPYSNPIIYTEYFQIPLFVKFGFPVFKKAFQISGKIGAGVSYATAGYQESDNLISDSSSDVIPIEFDSYDGFQRFDKGFYGGLGIGKRIGPGTLELEVELYRGLNNINTHVFDFKNRTRSLSLGYTVDLQK